MSVNVDIQILSLQVSQGIQEKAQSTQGPVDKSVQESPREGAHNGEWLDRQNNCHALLSLSQSPTCYFENTSQILSVFQMRSLLNDKERLAKRLKCVVSS